MNKKFLLPFFVLAAILTLSSCSNKLKPLAEQYIKAEPQPLEAIGGKVPVTINATFPAKWFNKKAVVTVTPVCVTRVAKLGALLTLTKVRK